MEAWSHDFTLTINYSMPIVPSCVQITWLLLPFLIILINSMPIINATPFTSGWLHRPCNIWKIHLTRVTWPFMHIPVFVFVHMHMCVLMLVGKCLCTYGMCVLAHACRGMRLPSGYLPQSLTCALSRITYLEVNVLAILASQDAPGSLCFCLLSAVIAVGPQHTLCFLHVFWRFTLWSSHLWASVFIIDTSCQPTLLYCIFWLLFFFDIPSPLQFWVTLSLLNLSHSTLWNSFEDNI